MDWVPWVLDIPVDVAQEKGFYADHGLKVKQTLPAGPTDVAKFVSTGKAQFGLYYAPDTLMGVAAGAPLLSVGEPDEPRPGRHGHGAGRARRRRRRTWQGKTAGVVMIPSTRASFATMLKAGGVDPGAVKVADPGFDLVAPLLAGKYELGRRDRVRRARRGRGRRGRSSTTSTSATGARPTSRSSTC